jgi:hypothetical protein
MSEFKMFRYSRLQLIRKSADCIPWGLLAVVLVLTAPYGVFRWLGLLPLVGCVAYWIFVLHPKWHYVIRVDEKRLCISSAVYRWSQLDNLQMERRNGRRSIRLTDKDGKELVIKDDLPEFRELTQACLFHMSKADDEVEPALPFGKRPAETIRK